jgi:cytochrome c
MSEAPLRTVSYFGLGLLVLTCWCASALLGRARADSAAKAGDPDAGAEVYRNVCKECHGGSLAPPLRGVVGRAIASAPDFDYSDALIAKKSLTWTPENLDTFLTSPDDFAPGTQMKKKDLTAQDRADVIAYLASLSAATR